MNTHATSERKVNSNRAIRTPRWLLSDGIHATVQRFAEAWSALPRTAWRTWLGSIVFGWILTAILMLALVWFARTYIGDETSFFLRSVEAVPLSFHASIWVETPGNSVFLIPVILVAATIAVWWNAPLRALSIIAAFCVIDTIVLIGWLVWDRARPTLMYNGIATPGFHSFPSGHVAQTIAVYGLLTYFWIAASRRRSEQCFALLLCLGLVVAVGLARLCLGTHWPSDLVAGAVIGGTWVAVIIVALRRAEALLVMTGDREEVER